MIIDDTHHQNIDQSPTRPLDDEIDGVIGVKHAL